MSWRERDGIVMMMKMNLNSVKSSLQFFRTLALSLLIEREANDDGMSMLRHQLRWHERIPKWTQQWILNNLGILTPSFHLTKKYKLNESRWQPFSRHLKPFAMKIRILEKECSCALVVIHKVEFISSISVFVKDAESTLKGSRWETWIAYTM